MQVEKAKGIKISDIKGVDGLTNDLKIGIDYSTRLLCTLVIENTLKSSWKE